MFYTEKITVLIDRHNSEVDCANVRTGKYASCVQVFIVGCICVNVVVRSDQVL